MKRFTLVASFFPIAVLLLFAGCTSTELADANDFSDAGGDAGVGYRDGGDGAYADAGEDAGDASDGGPTGDGGSQILDSGQQDASLLIDSGAIDAGESEDAGADAGPPDAGPPDAGLAEDAGNKDAGTLFDAGLRDAGVWSDGGGLDAGQYDSGQGPPPPNDSCATPIYTLDETSTSVAFGGYTNTLDTCGTAGALDAFFAFTLATERSVTLRADGAEALSILNGCLVPAQACGLGVPPRIEQLLSAGTYVVGVEVTSSSSSVILHFSTTDP